MQDLKKIPTWLPVVAAAIVHEDGRVLMQQRPEGKHHAGLWEFPGGKVEDDETPASALVREIKEELDLTLDPAFLTPAGFAQSDPVEGERAIVILLYSAAQWRGEPRALEGGDWGWFSLEEISALEMPPLDKVLHDQLKRAG